MNRVPAEARRRLLARVHLLRRERGLEEADYRALLKNTTGKNSCKTMAPKELLKVIARLNPDPRARGARGWNERSGVPSSRPKSQRRDVRALYARWYALGHHGALETPDWRGGLRAWLRRHYGVADPEWLTPQQCARANSALDQWQQRVGAPRPQGRGAGRSAQ